MPAATSSTALNTIGHGILINKLAAFRIEGRELAWLTDYLFNSSQTVEINGCTVCPRKSGPLYLHENNFQYFGRYYAIFISLEG